MNELANQYGGGEAVARRGADEAALLHRLNAFIADGGFSPGDRLPPERQLTAELSLPRGALRKALDALEREGRIWRQVGKGTFIASPTDGAVPSDVVALSRQITPLKMVRARLCIEPAIACEAAVNASAEALASMFAARDAAVAAMTWQEYEAEDDRFHRAIAEAADNPLLLSLFDTLNAVRRKVALQSVQRVTPRPSRDHASFAEHAEIADAIAERDPTRALRAMRAHVRAVSARLFDEP